MAQLLNHLGFFVAIHTILQMPFHYRLRCRAAWSRKIEKLWYLYLGSDHCANDICQVSKWYDHWTHVLTATAAKYRIMNLIIFAWIFITFSEMVYHLTKFCQNIPICCNCQCNIEITFTIIYFIKCEHALYWITISFLLDSRVSEAPCNSSVRQQSYQFDCSSGG